ncbi:hypothetical protein MIND_00260700 [Mycena indigotica]|uniref:Uncharacterized protein n=1 Tax=Mycena indigotica TaxID=2126181 RepID=A0A8H6T7Q6_9AGAR|nr:uncharacterized protein MIND_00260700 [Mycena indigotica]KAF7312471.1 hypothetical protein MIND_00260700 [Mycena indigotica]
MPTAGQRPRPKPKFKGKGAADTSIIESFSENPISSSLSDRVKMRDRGKRVDPVSSSLRDNTNIQSDIIEIASDSDDELSFLTKPKKLVTKTRPLSKSIPSSSLPASDPFPESTNTNTNTNTNDPPPLHDDNSIPPINVLPQPPSSSPSPAQVVKPPKKPRKKKDTDGEKPPRKPRTKKSKNGDDDNAEKPTKKRKEKEKEKQFTSAEFVADSDDNDGDRLPLANPISEPIPGPSRSKPISTVSVPDSQPDEELVLPIVSAKRKREVDQGAGSSGKDAKKAKVASAEEPKSKKVAVKKGKRKAIITDDEDDEGDFITANLVERPDEGDIDMGPELPGRSKPLKKKTKNTVVSDSEDADPPSVAVPSKPQSPPHEPVQPISSQVLSESTNHKQHDRPEGTPKPHMTGRYSIGARTKSTPLTELIRKVNAQPGSPFPVAVPRRNSVAGVAPGTPVTTYSPYAKFSRSAIARIAPLHPNRKTPPPPPPPPPPKPKTKKEKEREERWEEEMIEAVGGWDAWQALSEQDQKAAKRAKWARELEGWDD